MMRVPTVTGRAEPGSFPPQKARFAESSLRAGDSPASLLKNREKYAGSVKPR